MYTNGFSLNFSIVSTRNNNIKNEINMSNVLIKKTFQKYLDNSSLLFLKLETSLVALILKPKSTIIVKKIATDCAIITNPYFSDSRTLTK